MISAGRLRHRVEIQSRSRGPDLSGGIVDTWTTLDTVWASIEPLTGREYHRAEAERAESMVDIVMRHYEGLSADHRLKFGAVIYDIVSVRNIRERDIMTVASCREGVTDG